jgi:predicted RNA binding protein YcfA (HicA-like mRNA interferase family)
LEHAFDYPDKRQVFASVLTIFIEDIIVLKKKVSVKGKEFLRRLKAAGVVIMKGRGKGGHVRAGYGEAWSTIPMHGDADIDPQFLKRICKQLGIDPAKIL